MSVFYRVLILLVLIGACLHTAEAKDAYQVIQQTTNQGTFYAYHDQRHPAWWYMAVPDVAAYTYNSSSTAFYIRPAGSENVYQVNLLKRLDKLPAAQMKRQEVSGVDIQGYSDIRQWQVYVYNRFCGSVLASQEAADAMRLNFVDQVRISQGLRSAFSQEINRDKPCDDFHIPAVMGRLVGYGLALEGRGIKSDVTNIETAGTLPESYLTRAQTDKATPLNDEGRLELMLAALPPEARAAFERLTSEQPPKAVIRAIQAQYTD